MQVNTYNSQTGQFNATAITCMPLGLSSDDMQGWIENPAELQQALKKALLPAEQNITVPQLKVWRTIRLGTGPRIEDHFFSALKKAGFNRDAKKKEDIFHRIFFSASHKEEEVELVRVTLDEIGLSDGATLTNIYKRVDRLGLDLCTPEAGPQLGLQYDTKEIESLHIGMKPLIPAGGGEPAIFGLTYNINEHKFISLLHGNPYVFFADDGSWIFKRRKSPVGL